MFRDVGARHADLVSTHGGPFANFVGRETELEFLSAAFRRVKAESRGTRLFVAGESGVGKSRLLSEFERRVRRERCVVLRGACVEYLATPYEPFIEALLGDDRSSGIERELRGARVEAAQDVELERLRRFRLVEDFLRRRAAAVGSLLLVIEDMHWSDAATFELWRFLGQRLHDAPILLIGAYRSDELALDPTRAAQLGRALREGARELALAPLSDREIAELLRAAAPGEALPGSAECERIVELAEGKPLIAEELLLGALQAAPGDESSNSAALSVRETVIARFRRLSEPEQAIVLTAAVFGRDFRADVLAELSGVPDEVVLAALRRARNVQLVVETGSEFGFRFRHAITREVLYRELLAGEVRVLHRKIAAGLETRGNGDEAAYHWWAAGVAERAGVTNEAAGDRATAIYAYADAARFYERALASAAGDVRRRLVEKVAFAFCAVGDMARARAWCQDDAGALRRSGDDAAAQRLLLWVARQLYESGEVDRALETIALVREEQRGTAATPVHHAAAMTLAGIYSTLGRAEEAIAILDEAAAFACEPDELDRFRAHNARGNALCSLGSYAAARLEYTGALEVARRLENAELQSHALGNAGNAAVLTGAGAAAREHYASGLALARRHGLQRQGSILASGAALVALHAGELREALRAFREISAARSVAPMTLGFVRAVGLRLHGLLAGEPDLVALDASGALEIALELRESQVIAIVAGAGARSALECGEPGRARALVERALPHLSEPDHAYWLCDAAAESLGEEAAFAARALLQRARAFDDNPAAEAFAALFEARVAARSDAAAGAARALAAARAFVAIGRPAEAAAAFELAGDVAAARGLYESIGATRALRRLAGGEVRHPPGAASGLPGLTRRERQIAEFAARGYASRLIASELGIGERTVETHLAVVYRKLGVKSRTELAALLS